MPDLARHRYAVSHPALTLPSSAPGAAGIGCSSRAPRQAVFFGPGSGSQGPDRRPCLHQARWRGASSSMSAASGLHSARSQRVCDHRTIRWTSKLRRLRRNWSEQSYNIDFPLTEQGASSARPARPSRGRLERGRRGSRYRGGRCAGARQQMEIRSSMRLSSYVNGARTFPWSPYTIGEQITSTPTWTGGCAAVTDR